MNTLVRKSVDSGIEPATLRSLGQILNLTDHDILSTYLNGACIGIGISCVGQAFAQELYQNI